MALKAETISTDMTLSRGRMQVTKCYINMHSYDFYDMMLCHWIAGTTYDKNFAHEIVTENMMWATTWENLFMPYANNKGANQPAYPHSLINVFVVTVWMV